MKCPKCKKGRNDKNMQNVTGSDARVMICVHCRAVIHYSLSEAFTTAYERLAEHDRQCPKNPLMGELSALRAENAKLKEQRNRLHAIIEAQGVTMCLRDDFLLLTEIANEIAAEQKPEGGKACS